MKITDSKPSRQQKLTSIKEEMDKYFLAIRAAFDLAEKNGTTPQRYLDNGSAAYDSLDKASDQIETKDRNGHSYVSIRGLFTAAMEAAERSAKKTANKTSDQQDIAYYLKLATDILGNKIDDLRNHLGTLSESARVRKDRVEWGQLLVEVGGFVDTLEKVNARALGMLERMEGTIAANLQLKLIRSKDTGPRSR